MSEELRPEITRMADGLAPVADRSQFMPAMSIELAVERYNTITEFVSRVLRRDVDYGMIPGTEKLTLLKPGAEKLTTFFGLSTRFQLLERIEDWTGAHHKDEPFFYYLYRCQLFRGDLLVAEADGSCNSRETKYRYREAQRVCPECNQAAIIKGKEEYGGGWLCLQPDTPVLYSDYIWRPIGEAKLGDEILAFDEYPAGHNIPRKFRPSIIEQVWASRQQTRRIITEDADIFFAGGLATHNCFRKKGGCGAKFPIGDATIESQQTGRVPNAEIADQVNTIQKMAQKRSLIAATLLAVNASEFFTQDVEDFINTTAKTLSTPSVNQSKDEPAVGPTVDENGLKRELLAACRRLAKTEAQLTDYLKKRYGVDGIGALTTLQKREVLSFLLGKIAQQEQQHAA